MAFLNDDERSRIAQAIAEVERRTRGELVTVVARAADDYLYIPLLWAALGALLLPGLMMLFADPGAALVYEVQVIAFFALAIVFNLAPVKMRLIPAGVKHGRAHRLAMEQFFAQNLHHTAERTGVLIFVSVAERHVEIIADQGINQRVTQDTWDRAVADFTAQVRAGKIADGFLHAIRDCGEILVEHFPAQQGDKNELPNHLIEIG